MPRSVRLMRLWTAIVTMILVAVIMFMTDGDPRARIIAGGILVFGAAQWLLLGVLAKTFHSTSSDQKTNGSNTDI